MIVGFFYFISMNSEEINTVGTNIKEEIEKTQLSISHYKNLKNLFPMKMVLEESLKWILQYQSPSDITVIKSIFSFLFQNKNKSKLCSQLKTIVHISVVI